MRIFLSTTLLFFVLGGVVAQDPPPSHDKGHEDGAAGHSCHHSLDPALKKGGTACASQGACKRCERAMDENGEPDPSGQMTVVEQTSCTSYCHKKCCHCPNPCQS
jgi:hypothetical protein